MIFVKILENLLKSKMKTLSIVILVTLFALTGCENPLKKSGKKPSKSELKMAIFEELMPFLTFHQFDPNFEDNPEKAKENKYQVYVDIVLSYSEPLYEGCRLNNPFNYREKGMEPLAVLCIRSDLGINHRAFASVILIMAMRTIFSAVAGECSISLFNLR